MKSITEFSMQRSEPVTSRRRFISNPFRDLRLLICVFLICTVSPSLIAQTMSTSDGSTATKTETADPQRQSRDDAWWTGPIIANSASTLPEGHVLLEPYLYDVHSSHGDGLRSLTYMQYGLIDGLTVGLVPLFGFNSVKNGSNSSGIGGAGDFALEAQIRLRQYREDSWLPAMALLIEETLPTGKYDKIGSRQSDGLGSGTYMTTVQLSTQNYFWLPNGRILRLRLNIGESWSRRTTVDGASVYGTSDQFQGKAKPGNTFFFDAAWEYSITRQWALAAEFACWHGNRNKLDGLNLNTPDPTAPDPIQIRSNTSDSYAFAPAIEYSFNSNVGVLLGARYMTGKHTTTTITPAVALNFVH